jgi:hypothetical protein
MKTYSSRRMPALAWKLGLSAVAAALLAGVSTSLAQDKIGINFAGRQWSIGGNTPMTLNPLDTAGVVSQQNWNNVMLDAHDSGGLAQIGGPNAGVVSDNSGAATGVTFSYTQGGNATEWAVDQTTHTGNRQLLDGYWDIQSASGAVDLGSLSYSLYDVYVYISSDGNGRTGSVSINGGPQTYLLTDANGYNYSNPLIQATATTQGSAASAHYVLFTNVSGADFEVVLSNYGSDVGVAGVQIVDVSGLYKPTVSFQPVSEELYAGHTAQFTVSASGTGPFYYHWRLNGVYLSDSGNLFGSTSTVLSITNVTTTNSGNYDVVITNTYGANTSAVAQLTVVLPAYAYEEAVLSNSPIAYYRLNENSDSETYNNLPAFDYIGGDNGVYGVPTANLFYGVDGPQPADGFPGFETNNGAVELFSGYGTSQITVPSWNLNGNTVTIAAWVYPLGGQQPNAGLVFNRGANVAGLDYSGNTDASGNYTLGYTWNNDPGTFFWNSGLVPPASQWSLVVLVVTPSNATIYLANTNGVSAAVHTYPHVAQSFSGPIAFGNDPLNTSGSRVFNGIMDEVAAFNQALTSAQVLTLYAGASGVSNFAPAIANQPASQAPFAQENARFSVAAVGAQPLGYQWQAISANGSFTNLTDAGRISGSQTATLAIRNVTASDPTNYVVLITNAFGSITSSPAALTVTASSYANAVLASDPVAYYSFNESSNPAAGGLIAYDYVGGFNGTYGTDVQNGYDNIAGPQPADGFSEFATNNWAAKIIANDPNGHVVVTPWNLNTNTVTMTCWIRPAAVEPSFSGLVFSRDGSGTQAGLNFSGNTDASGNRTLSYTWGDVCCWDSQLAPPTNQWSFVALVVTPTNATIYLYNTNSTNSAALANTHGALPFSGVTGIGVDPFDLTGRNFNGVIDEVAVFSQALSPSQIASLYEVGVNLTSRWDGATLTLNWTGGLLLQATNVTGPWTTNGNSSPLQVNPQTSGPRMFYRVLKQ